MQWIQIRRELAQWSFSCCSYTLHSHTEVKEAKWSDQIEAVDILKQCNLPAKEVAGVGNVHNFGEFPPPLLSSSWASHASPCILKFILCIFFCHSVYLKFPNFIQISSMNRMFCCEPPWDWICKSWTAKCSAHFMKALPAPHFHD